MTSHLSSRSFLFFFLSSFSKLPLFRRKLHQSLAFLPSFHAPTFQMRFLSRALSRSASSIDDEYPWIHSLSKERIIFQKVTYLFIFFSFLETRHFRTPFFLSLSLIYYFFSSFSFLRLFFSLSLSRCPTIFSLSLFNRGVCGGRVLKK